MRWCALLLFLGGCATAMSSQCRDPKKHQIEVDGNNVHGTVPISKVGAQVTVYSSTGKKVYVGRADLEAGFQTGYLRPDDYCVIVDGFGEFQIKLEPRIVYEWGASPDYLLLLRDDGAAAVFAIMN